MSQATPASQAQAAPPAGSPSAGTPADVTALVGTPAPTPSAPGTGSATAYTTLGTSSEDDVARRQAAQVPGTLGRLRLGAVAVCLVFGVLTALQLTLSWQANRTAAADTEQLIRVQDIKTSLLRADALATNAFLIGGLEPAEQRAAYDDAIDQTVRAITDGAEAQPADRGALNALSGVVLDYSGDMELARANNRQGLPVGGAYLRRASSELRTTALPIVDQLVRANKARAGDAMGAHHPWLVLLPALVAVALLWLANRWIGRRFHRRVNPGLLVALAAVGLVGVVAAFVTNGQQDQNDELSAGSFQAVVDGSTARTAANDAKANESLRLIARGSGQAFEDAWAVAASSVDQALLDPTLSGLRAPWSTYKSLHLEIVDLDTGGRWDEAVAAATSAEDGSSSDSFADFDGRLQDSLGASGTITTDTLTNGNSVLLVLAAIAVLIALAAAGFAAAGVNQRLKEYP
jgi:hypothetical protein